MHAQTVSTIDDGRPATGAGRRARVDRHDATRHTTQIVTRMKDKNARIACRLSSIADRVASTDSSASRVKADVCWQLTKSGALCGSAGPRAHGAPSSPRYIRYRAGRHRCIDWCRRTIVPSRPRDHDRPRRSRRRAWVGHSRRADRVPPVTCSRPGWRARRT